MHHVIWTPVHIWCSKQKYQSRVSAMGKVAGIVLLCIATAGSSAWHDIPNSVTVAKKASLDNNYLPLIDLWTQSIEKELTKCLYGIPFPKIPKINDDKMDDEDVNEWVNNNQLSFSRNRRLSARSGYGQKWNHLLRLD